MAVVSRAQLTEHGQSAEAIRGLLDRDELSTVVRGLYLVRGAPLTYRARLWAAAISTDGALGFATAAELWGVVDQRDPRVHVVIAHARRVYPPRWVRVHRVPLPAKHVIRRDGLPMTTMNWTLFDHLGTLSSDAAVRLADRALQRGWIDRPQLISRLQAHPRRHGNRLLRLLVDITDDGAAAESERRLHQLLRQARIYGWKPNYPVWVNGELIAVVDAAIPGRKLAIEVDGMAYHVDVDRFQRDRTRQNGLTMHGWTVLRFTWADLVDRPGYVVNALTRLGS